MTVNVTSTRARLRPMVGQASAALAIFVGAWMFQLSTTDGGVALWHPMTAITLLVLVVGGVRWAPVVLVAHLLATLLIVDADSAFLELVLVVPVVVLPYVAVAAVVRRWFRLSIRRAGLREVCWTLGLCGIATPIVAGSAWLASQAVIGRLPDDVSLWRPWLSFVVGDAVAVLGLVPGALVALALVGRWRAKRSRLRVAAVVETVTMLAVIVGTCVLAVHVSYDRGPSIFYVLFAPFLWVALRHGLIGTAAAASVGTITVVVLMHSRNVTATDALEVQAFLTLLLAATFGVGAEVSDRRRAEAATRDAETRFHSAFDRSTIGMALIGAEPHNAGLLIQVNEALGHILGYAPADLVGRNIRELSRPEDHPVGWQAFRKLAAGSETAELTKRYLHADGHEIWCRVRAGAVTDDSGRIIYSISHIEDVTLERLQLQRLSYEAAHDPLTRLLNRFGLGEHAGELDLTSSWTPILYIDLDRFKLVNDNFGHAAGDDVLVAVADRLRASVRDGDIVARMGGDEFVVLAAGTFRNELAARAIAFTLANRISDQLDDLDAVAGGLPIAASVGVTVGRPGSSLDDLLRAADDAMFTNKQQRRIDRGDAHLVDRRPDERSHAGAGSSDDVVRASAGS
jgi:diguanylate cyclase (GGDEF)-like protein/PAS domain S-box-containing protein